MRYVRMNQICLDLNEVEAVSDQREFLEFGLVNLRVSGRGYEGSEEQMLADGATEEQVEQFLQQIGMTLEELEMAEEMFGMGEGALGFTI